MARVLSMWISFWFVCQDPMFMFSKTAVVVLYLSFALSVRLLCGVLTLESVPFCESVSVTEIGFWFVHYHEFKSVCLLFMELFLFCGA